MNIKVRLVKRGSWEDCADCIIKIKSKILWNISTYEYVEKIDDYTSKYLNNLFDVNLIFYDPSRILQLSEFLWTLRSSVLAVIIFRRKPFHFSLTLTLSRVTHKNFGFKRRLYGKYLSIIFYLCLLKALNFMSFFSRSFDLNH